MASRRSREILAAICAGVGAAILAVGLLLASLHIVAFQESHYRTQYERLNIPAATRIAMPDLMEVTRIILAYLSGESDSMQSVAPVDGTAREVFTQRELDHMVDVRDLMLLARDVMLPVLGVGALFILLSWMFCVGGSKRGMARGLLWGEGVFLALLAAVGVYGIIDFDNLFVRFHLLFFSNDLWQLNPSQSILINMVPQPFFIATSARIAVMWGGFLVIEIALSAWLLLYSRKRDRATDVKPPVLQLPGPARPQLPDQMALQVVSVGKRGDPEESRYVIDGQTGVRPDAQAIFDRFGLSDEDDPEEETVQPMPGLPVTLAPSLAPGTQAAGPLPTPPVPDSRPSPEVQPSPERAARPSAVRPQPAAAQDDEQAAIDARRRQQAEQRARMLARPLQQLSRPARQTAAPVSVPAIIDAPINVVADAPMQAVADVSMPAIADVPVQAVADTPIPAIADMPMPDFADASAASAPVEPPSRAKLETAPEMRWFSTNIWGSLPPTAVSYSPITAPDSSEHSAPEHAAPVEPSPGSVPHTFGESDAPLIEPIPARTQEQALALIDQLEVHLNDTKAISVSSLQLLVQLRDTIQPPPTQGGALALGEEER